MNILKAPSLKPGDTIGIVAPCLPVLPSAREYYEQGKRSLQKMGFTLKEGKTIGLQHWYSAGTPQQQAADINAMFADSSVKALVAASGGHSAISVLGYLDFDLIRKNPKPFIGMSDMTCYHLAIFAQTGMVGFHMDEVTFGIGWNWAKDEFKNAGELKETYFRALTQTKPLGELPQFIKPEVWRPGKAEGQLIGGNINSMSCQMGTPYFPALDAFDGAILFWEAVGRSKYDLLRILYQLKYFGALQRISGMLVGTISDIKKLDKEIVEPEVKDIVLEVTKDYNFPILAGMDFGHYTVNLPMPIGVRAGFNTATGRVALLEAAVI